MLINIFGSPGSGKSTFAMYLVSELKLRGLNAEFAPEYIKTLIAKGESNFDQLDLLLNQYKQIKAYYNNSDYVITDSPLLLSKVYNKEYPYKNTLNRLVDNFNNEFINFNVLIDPPDNESLYKDSLRLQNYKESLDLFYNEFINLTNYDMRIYNFFSCTRKELSSLCDMILK